MAVSIGIGVNIKGNALIKKWFEATEEPTEKEVKKVAPQEKKEKPNIEIQLEIAKITAERDVYKRLYEEAVARR